MVEINCSVCKKSFNDKDALEMHFKAKHPEKVQKENRPFPIKKVRNWTITLIIIGLISWGVYSMMNSPDSFDNLPAEEINIGSHQNIALHIHSDLKILIDGEEFPIPANIGVSTGIMRPVHTHDATGKIHIEGPYPRDFTLGDFFNVWQKEFNSTCIFEYCTIPGVGAMEMFVNGEKSEAYDSLVLKDSQQILIEYHSF